MTKQSFLAWLVVVRRDEQSAICAGFLSKLRCFDRIARGIRPRAGNDLATAICDFDHALDNFVFLIVRQRRRFASCSNSDNTCDAGANLRFN